MSDHKAKAEQLRQELAQPYTGEYLLEVRHLKKYFRVGGRLFANKNKDQYVRAVDDVSFAIRPGETLGIVGESGCGKKPAVRSTLKDMRSPKCPGKSWT